MHRLEVASWISSYNWSSTACCWRRAYTIISLGLTLIFGVVRVVNFAHGEFLMVGMYLVYLIAAQFGVHPYLGLAPVAVILFALGALTQKGIIQPLLNADQHIQIFATVGVSTILLNLALVLFGANVLRAPVQLGTSAIDVGSYSMVSGQIITFVVGISLAVLLHLFMHRTYLAGRCAPWPSTATPPR